MNLEAARFGQASEDVVISRQKNAAPEGHMGKFSGFGIAMALAVLVGGASVEAQERMMNGFSPRPATPRVPIVPENERTPEQFKVIDGRKFNLYYTLAHNPPLYERWRPLGSFLLNRSSLPARQRELLIMRTAYQINSPYECSHHVPLAKQAGLTDAEIARIIEGPDAAGWKPEEAALLRAVDELRREAFVSDATWAVLAKAFNTQQMFEIVYTTGGYSMTGFAINSLGIQVEPGYPKAPF